MNMGSRFMSISTFVSEQDDSENSGDSPRFAMLNDGKMASTSSPKKRRSIQKRVISVPIKYIEGSRIKSETGGAPPSDSWSWRKYGQKPIKGSPYPRGYYKCSSSKGCPARKQVEKSMLDPNMLMVTYSYEHNHPWPTPRNHHNHNVSTRKTPIQTETTNSGEEYQEEEEQKPTINLLATQKSSDLINNSHIDDKKYGNHGAEATNLISDYGCTNNWFSDFECTSSTTMLESPLMSDARVTDSDMAMVFTMRDEDDSFFADLGELPECSTVFRHRGLMIDREEEHHRRHNLAPWCGTI